MVVPLRVYVRYKQNSQINYQGNYSNNWAYWSKDKIWLIDNIINSNSNLYSTVSYTLRKIYRKF